MILVAVDAGGTSTRASVVDESLSCVGVGRAGRGNPISAGAESAFDEIVAAMRGAAAAARVELSEVGGITLAGAGGAAFEPDFISRRLASVGVRAPLTVRGDLAALFCSGTHETSGYSLVAGTGATGARIVDSTEVSVADGVGWLLGDTGSGFWIGRRVARAVTAALDGRAPTSMVGPALAMLGVVTDPTLRQGRSLTSHHVISTVYARSPLELAALAPVAFLDDSDNVSMDIVKEAANGLAQDVIDVHVDDIDGPVVIGGGVMAGQPRLRDRTVAALESAGLTLRVIEATDGLVGAAVLGLRDSGVEVDAPAFEALRSTTAAHEARARQLQVSRRPPAQTAGRRQHPHAGARVQRP